MCCGLSSRSASSWPPTSSATSGLRDAWASRSCGSRSVSVDRWPCWRSRHPDGTEYWLSMIPLGGYVKMLDERETPVPAADRGRAFNQRPIPHRIAVLAGGSRVQLPVRDRRLLADVYDAACRGSKPVIGAVQPDSVAARAGIVAGDEIDRGRRPCDVDVGKRDAANLRPAARPPRASTSPFASRTAKRGTFNSTCAVAKPS